MPMTQTASTCPRTPGEKTTQGQPEWSSEKNCGSTFQGLRELQGSLRKTQVHLGVQVPKSTHFAVPRPNPALPFLLSSKLRPMASSFLDQGIGKVRTMWFLKVVLLTSEPMDPKELSLPPPFPEGPPPRHITAEHGQVPQGQPSYTGRTQPQHLDPFSRPQINAMFPKGGGKGGRRKSATKSQWRRRNQEEL